MGCRRRRRGSRRRRETAHAVRPEFPERRAGTSTPMFGTHFATPSAGRIVGDGAAWRFDCWKPPLSARKCGHLIDADAGTDPAFPGAHRTVCGTAALGSAVRLRLFTRCSAKSGAAYSRRVPSCGDRERESRGRSSAAWWTRRRSAGWRTRWGTQRCCCTRRRAVDRKRPEPTQRQLSSRAWHSSTPRRTRWPLLGVSSPGRRLAGSAVGAGVASVGRYRRPGSG